jgi:hypothetical protein
MTVAELKAKAKENWMRRPESEKIHGGFFSDEEYSCSMDFTHSGTMMRADHARYSFRVLRDGDWKVISVKNLTAIIG